MSAAGVRRFRLERSDRIATLTFDWPEKRNPVDEEVLLELERIVHEVRDDERIRVLVVTGSGNTFSSGANLSTTREIADAAERERHFATLARSRVRLLGRVVDALVHLEQVTIAAVNGYAVGAGWDLALACDLRIAVEEAEFWFPEVDLGVPLSPEATALLLEHVPPSIAKEMILGCARYRAEELVRFGLVNRVVPKAAFAAAVRELAETLARKSPAAVTGTKATVNALAHRRGLLRLDLLRTRD